MRLKSFTASVLAPFCWMMGCGPGSPDPGAQKAPETSEKTRLVFESDTLFQRLDLTYRNDEQAGRLAILESLGGGIALFDYDLDGHLDVCTPGGGTFQTSQVAGLPSKLIRQSGTGRWVDVSEPANIDSPKYYSHGVCCGDWDQDGFTDLLITGYGGVTLWQNQGDGTFLDVTDAAGLDDRSWSSSGAFADLNSDGFPDLYLCHYVNWSLENDPPCRGPSGNDDVCPPRSFDGLTDALYVNAGDGAFRSATREAGLVEGGKGLGVLVTDVDNDGKLDIYVANDTTNNFLYLNQGQLRFEENGLVSGVALDHNATANGSMGLAAADISRNGFLDLFVTNYEEELIALYENLGANQFQHISTKAGFSRIGTLYVGFGCVAADFNMDGLTDLCISNGHVVHHPRKSPVRQNPLMLVQQPGATFLAAVPAGTDYFQSVHRGRGLATGDLNRDGLPDLAFSPMEERAELLINRTTRELKSLSIRLIGIQSDRSGVGSRVTVQSGEYSRMQQVVGGGSYLSTSDLELFFAVPHEETVTVTVEWLSGVTDSITFQQRDLYSERMAAQVLILEPLPTEDSGRWFDEAVR